MQTIDRMIIVKPQISIWCGQKKLNPEEIGLNPPEDLVTLGNKRIVPKERLRYFDTLKKKVDRILSNYGIKLLGGFAVSEDMVETINSTMQELEKEFLDLRDEFLRNYPDYVEEQVANYPDWEKNLRAAALEVELEKKFRFTYKVYKLKPPQEEESEAEVNNQFITDDEVEEQAVVEIEKLAEKALLTLSGKEKVQQGFLRSIRNIRTKVQNIVTVNRQFFGELIRLIDNVLGEMPGKGEINGQDRKLLTSLLIVVNDLKTHWHPIANDQYDSPDNLLLAVGYNLNPASEFIEAAETEENPASPDSDKESVDVPDVPDVPKQEGTRQAEEFVWF